MRRTDELKAIIYLDLDLDLDLDLSRYYDLKRCTFELDDFKQI